MYYNELCGESVSALGMGAMRLPTDDEGKIDEQASQEIIDYAFDNGINYYDTAYMYHGGASETFLGKALAGRERSSYLLADKFPGFAMGDKSIDEIFNEQLERCRTDYFDFYLLHNVNERSIVIYLDEEMEILDYFKRKKEQGVIRHLGFSSHGKPEMFEQFCDVFDWDFAQIEMNYLDWTLQNSEAQYQMAVERDLPLVVMEPVRGGRLASLTPEADEILKRQEPEWSIASWAFKWLMEFDNAKIALSGMTTMEQLKDNLKTYASRTIITAEQKAALKEANELLKGAVNVPCTQCAYCVDDCPQGLNIPDLINIYNNYTMVANYAVRQAMGRLTPEQRPENCIACGVCLDHCPQAINIPGVLVEFDGVMDQAVNA